jgi:hypothetical protein
MSKYDKVMDKEIKKRKKKAEQSKYGAYRDASANESLARALKAKSVMDFANKTYSPGEKKWGKDK